MGRLPRPWETVIMNHTQEMPSERAKKLGDELFELQKQQLAAREGEIYIRMSACEREDFDRRNARIAELFMLLAERRAA
jgi:hypothetical protein